MTPRAERTAYLTGVCALWLLFFVQATNAAVLLDDWFQVRYWRDHDLGLAAMWAYARHNYFHYNPRIGENFLAIIDGSRTIHLIATPLVQLAALATVFVIALGRWPRPTLRDLQLLLFLQTMIWLVIPIPGIMYFYRPYATNYLWAFTITLALFVPYRLALASAAPRAGGWLSPITLVLGWLSGMCNEHTGPTAIVALAALGYGAWRRHQLRAWMVTGLIGLGVGYLMLFFAPGQQVRYGGLATHATPIALLAERGVTGGLALVGDFLLEARLGIFLFIAAIVRFALTRKRLGLGLPRGAVCAAAAIAAAAFAIVITLVASPTASDRVLYAPGVLLVAAFGAVTEQLYLEASLRRMLVAACLVAFGYHALRFVEAGYQGRADSDQRLALLGATRPGAVAVVPSYRDPKRSRWQLGDDFVDFPFLRDYVGGELFDLARVDVDQRGPAPAISVLAVPATGAAVPTYRQLQALGRPRLREVLGPQRRISIVGLFEDPRRRPLLVVEVSPTGDTFVDGHPEDTPGGHAIRVTRTTLPPRLEQAYVIGCGLVQATALPGDSADDPRLAVDERFCRGPFTAIVCQSDRCWVAGWY
jgi:hypothetical protein